ncbi:MAG: DUF4330 domain-containing protein [Clostridiales bacterium]|jgi:hypothetical protein|nr:DUF4330 domain-containing protein [Clostridiales bacterium]
MNEKTAKLRFTPLDAAIIAIILLAAAAAVWYLTRGAGGEPVDLRYTVEFAGKDASFEGLPQVGDTVYDSVRGSYLGVITDIEYTDSLVQIWNPEEGIYTQEAVPDTLNCYLTIAADGIERPAAAAIAASDIEIRVGKEMFVKGKGYASPGYIVWMELTPKEAE